MTQVGRAWLGFLVAPGAPASVPYLWGLYEGYGDAAIVGPALLLPEGYAATLILGVPAYLVLQRKSKYSLGPYLFIGAVIGLVPAFLMSGAASFPSAAQLMTAAKFMVIGAIYAAISSTIFWYIAVRPQQKNP